MVSIEAFTNQRQFIKIPSEVTTGHRAGRGGATAAQTVDVLKTGCAVEPTVSLVCLNVKFVQNLIRLFLFMSGVMKVNLPISMLDLPVWAGPEGVRLKPQCTGSTALADLRINLVWDLVWYWCSVQISCDGFTY